MPSRRKYLVWTEDMDAVVRRMWSGYTTPEIARKLGIKTSQVHARVRILRHMGHGLPAKRAGRPQAAAWLDGWSIRPPTREQKMAGR